MDLIASWHRERGMTTVLVTHDMDDVVHTPIKSLSWKMEQLFYMILFNRVFSDEEQIEKWHLDVPDARRFQRI